MKKYLNEFHKLKCSADIVPLRLFPNAKEITESMGAYHAVLNHIECDKDDPSTLLISVGDGNTPRTAGLFAFLTKWDCLSVDPRLKTKPEFKAIKRLAIVPEKIEDCSFPLINLYSQIIVVCVHSHAKLDVVYDKFKKYNKPLFIVAIPCCAPQEIKGKEFLGYRDPEIWSPKNEVRVWEKI